MADKIINNIVVDNDPAKFYAPNVLTGLEETEALSELKENLSDMNTATSADVGKALKVKTVTNGKVTEWEFGDVGGTNISCDVDANGNATLSLGEEDLSDIEELVGGDA